MAPNAPRRFVKKTFDIDHELLALVEKYREEHQRTAGLAYTLRYLIEQGLAHVGQTRG